LNPSKMTVHPDDTSGTSGQRAAVMRANVEVDIHAHADVATWHTKGRENTVPPLRVGISWARSRPSVSDSDLIGMLARGNTSALDTLISRHRRSALAIATNICGASLAEEAVQDAFLQVARASNRYRADVASGRNWVLGIVRLRAIDALRHDARHVRRRAAAEELDALCSTEELEAIVVQRDEARTVRSLLGALPVEQANIISMAYFDQLTHQEIARVTGLPVGTVKGRIRLGLAKLRQPMRAYGALIPTH
jgi:RNA polymerase sigma-70 factor (ECF subfamily)